MVPLFNMGSNKVKIPIGLQVMGCGLDELDIMYVEVERRKMKTYAFWALFGFGLIVVCLRSKGWR